MPFNLEAVRIRDRKRRYRFAEFENSQMVQRRLDVADLSLSGCLRPGRDTCQNDGSDC